MGSTGVNADPSCHYERMSVKPVAVFLVLDCVAPSIAATKWLCELGELWLGLYKARVIVLLVLYIAMEHRG